MIRIFHVLCLIAAACSPSSQPAKPAAATPAPATTAAASKPAPVDVAQIRKTIDELAGAAIRDHSFVGVSIAIARGDEVVTKGYGVADLAHGVPAAADTVYRIGSVTKQFTAVAILRLAERGKLGLHDDLRTYLPAYPAHDPPITIEHLLTHTSGIPSYTSVPNWTEIGKRAMPRSELVAMFATKPLEFAPGAQFAYSNSNYYLLGLIIEKLTGRTYAEAIRDDVLRPAGMTSSAYCDDQLPRRAAGYTIKPGGPEPSEPLDMAHPFAAGALCSTVVDLIAWQRALDGGKLLQPASLARMRTSMTTTAGTPTGYGYAVFLGELAGHHRIAHGGGINGFTAAFARYPDDDLTIVVLANAAVDATDKLEQRIARALLGIPAPTIKDEPVSAADRARYTGNYQLQGFGATAPVIRVFDDHGKLRSAVAGQDTTTLKYQGGDTFVLDADTSIELVFAAGAHPPSLTVHQSGMAIEAKRVP